MKFLSRYLTRLIKKGVLVVKDAKGGRYEFGEGGAPEVTIAFKRAEVVRKLYLHPATYLGEAYMDGDIVVERGDIRDLLQLVWMNLRWSDPGGVWLWRYLSWLTQFNSLRGARRNVSHHYDLSNDFYQLFLDKQMCYSCAYFRDASDSLDRAQQNKQELITKKLLLRDGQRLLDIGCGWGGMAFYLAKNYDVTIKGITLSREQVEFAKTRADVLGLDPQRVEFELQDYRQVTGKYDRIVSIGMFEHVGTPNYKTFFNNLRDNLKDDGVALLHTIGRVSSPGATNPWVRKYIFPGGYMPSLSQILTAIEKVGLYVTDIEVLRLHYAETLRHWWCNIADNREQIVEMYSQRFYRMWQFYLASSEMAFRYSDLVVFQLQLSPSQDAVPLTRDYLFEDGRF